MRFPPLHINETWDDWRMGILEIGMAWHLIAPEKRLNPFDEKATSRMLHINVSALSMSKVSWVTVFEKMWGETLCALVPESLWVMVEIEKEDERFSQFLSLHHMAKVKFICSAISKVEDYIWCGKTSGGFQVYFCAVCPYNTHYKFSARNHKRTVSYIQSFVWCGWSSFNHKVYFCSVCPYVSALRQGATRHSHKHTKEKPFQCPLCPKTFSYKFNIKPHIAAVHSTVEYLQDGIWKSNCTSSALNIFFCGYCDYKTNRRYNAIYQHARTHSSHKPFACHMCPAAFKWKQSLMGHLGTVHGIL
ncbi:unnamed protein product [Darwinula stevensoni]|uniref:C2H2-type domain-containing protein n=1 Tax=Darwinula stevensoni TaxID=69355 RepID=A0A7R8X0D3_9CRUS|nr:unnamed protein product [Darwinula stevensoni]CAG0878707.1 unnamed protein product [Darwinula stevensoni]